MTTVMMRDTGRRLVGYDKESGKVVRRKIYSDRDGNEYVMIGRFSMYDQDAHVSRQWFCDHVLTDGMIER